MRVGTSVLAFVFTLYFAAVLETRSDAATYGRAEILVPEPEDGLWVYQRACEREIKRRFVAELNRQHPEASEQTLSEKISVRADDERSTIVLFVEAEDANVALEDAMRMARVAVLRFVDMDESARKRVLDTITKARELLEENMRELERKLLSAQMASDLYDYETQMDSLVARITSYEDELELAELRQAQLKATSKFLAEKAAQANETVSFDEVGFLQTKAREIELKIEEASQSYGEKHPEMVRLKEQLTKIEDDVAKAKKEGSETGGANLAPIIAEKRLECETEMTGLKAMLEYLRPRIEELRRETRDKQSKSLELRRRQVEIGDIEERLQDLRDEERRLHTRAAAARKPEIISVNLVERIEP